MSQDRLFRKRSYMIKVSRVLKHSTRNYKKAANWYGFWITPDRQIYPGEESHQEILEERLGPEATYEEAFNKGWVRGFFQSGMAGFEANSLVGSIFNYIQRMVQEESKTFRIDEVLLDSGGRSYAVPLQDFLSLNKSGELRPYSIT